MGRLSGIALDHQNTETTARALSSFPQGTILVEKGPATRIWQAGKPEYYQLEVGGPYQATGGMGDTLAGMIAGFAGQFPHVNLYERVVVATHLHSAKNEKNIPKRQLIPWLSFHIDVTILLSFSNTSEPASNC